MWIFLPKCPEIGKVFLILCGIVQCQGTGIRVDHGKGVVDMGQLLGRDVGCLVSLVG